MYFVHTNHNFIEINYRNIIFQVVLIAAKGGNKESYVAIDQFQFLQIDKGCELFPPEAQPPTTPTTTEYTPTEPPNRKY